MNEKNILVLSLSKITPSSSRVLKEGCTLSKNGFSVTIASICYENQLEIEEIQDLPVKRFQLRTKKLPKSFIFQIVKWIEWYNSLKKWLKSGEIIPAIIDCHCLYTLLIGVMLAQKKGCKIVFNAHELETERIGFSNFRKKINKILERILIKYCSTTIVVSQSILEWYQQTYPCIDVHCIYNAPLYQQPVKNNYFRMTYNLSDTDIIFLYQGGFAVGRGIPLLLETFKELPQNYHIVFMGHGQLETEIKKMAHKYSNIHIHKVVPQEELYKYTSSADYGFSVIESIALNHEYCMPNKLFEYTMYEVPVIVSYTKDQASFVKTNKIGYVLQDYTSNGLKELILSIDVNVREEFIQNMRTIRGDICWDSQEKKLIDIYEKILG